MTSPNRLAWPGLLLAVTLLDQASKHWVLGWANPDAPYRVTRWFNVVLAHNQGAAFSFLANGGSSSRILFSLVALAALLFMGRLMWQHGDKALFCSGLALIMGGALGNLVDRLRLGTVTDFIQWHVGEHYWPAFNVADSAITAGVVILLLDQIRKPS